MRRLLVISGMHAHAGQTPDVDVTPTTRYQYGAASRVDIVWVTGDGIIAGREDLVIWQRHLTMLHCQQVSHSQHTSHMHAEVTLLQQQQLSGRLSSMLLDALQHA